MKITVEAVKEGKYRLLHCAEPGCNWPWFMHQADSPLIMRVDDHEFVIPPDIPSATI